MESTIHTCTECGALATHHERNHSSFGDWDVWYCTPCYESLLKLDCATRKAEQSEQNVSQSLTLPEGWTAPKFQLGQTVFVKDTCNESYVVVGLRYAPYRHLSDPIWFVQLSEVSDRDLTDLFNGVSFHGPEIDECELSAEPYPIPGEICLGLEGPCGRPATYWSNQWTGSDWETRRSVDLAYCPECWKRMEQIERDAREVAR